MISRAQGSLAVVLIVITQAVQLCSGDQTPEKFGRHSRRHDRDRSSGRGGKPDWTRFHQQFPLRPSPVMIPLDIQERPDKHLDPDLSKLDEYALLTLLDSDYDRQFMSLRQPLDMILNPNGTLHYEFKKDQTPSNRRMPSEIAALSEKEVKISNDGPPLRVKFKKRTKTKLQKFLWAYSYCPVRYKWKTLSIRFWPRWIKTGSCDNQRSCSIPAGMTCQPTRMRNIRILRYYCPIPGARKSCQWIKFDYPILDQCTCMCDSSASQQSYTSYL